MLLSLEGEMNEEDVGLPPASADAGEGEESANEEKDEPIPDGQEIFRDAKERVVRQFEHSYLVQVMAAVDGNVSRAARLAGMQRRDFQRLLRKHDIRRAQPRAWRAE